MLSQGIGRDSRHKRRETGGKRAHFRKKRKFELGRQAANTKLGGKRVHSVRTMGGNTKWRAMRLESGSFSWGSEVRSKKTRILDVVYNSSNNELLRTKTLVKNAIVQIDATPFRQWYEAHYGVEVGKKKKGAKADTAEKEVVKQSNHVKRTIAKRQEGRVIEPDLEAQFGSGRLLAAISSRPGQSGRCDGYVLEGPELAFYLKKMNTKKKK